MSFKRRVLSALGKDLLLEIGRGLELDVTTRMGVEELRDALAKSKRAKLDAIVQTLAHDFVQGGAPRVARCRSGENRAMNRATMARFSNQATTPRSSMWRLVATEPEVHARVRGGTVGARHCASAACTMSHQITLIEKVSTKERRHAKGWECEATELLQKDQQLASAERAFETFDATPRALPTPAEKRRAQRQATRPTPTDGFGEGGLVPKAGGAA